MSERDQPRREVNDLRQAEAVRHRFFDQRLQELEHSRSEISLREKLWMGLGGIAVAGTVALSMLTTWNNDTRKLQDELTLIKIQNAQMRIEITHLQTTLAGVQQKIDLVHEQLFSRRQYDQQHYPSPP